MKHDIDFKLKVIAYYQQDHSGSTTAKYFGIDKKAVSKWINQYQIGNVLAISSKTGKAVYIKCITAQYIYNLPKTPKG